MDHTKLGYKYSQFQRIDFCAQQPQSNCIELNTIIMQGIPPEGF